MDTVEDEIRHPHVERRGDFCFLADFGMGGVMANQLILIRHGDLGDRCRGRYIGRTDAMLSAEGRRQAAALARPLARLTGAFFLASPLRRTRDTAEIALGADGRFGIDENLREIDFGRWEGMSFAEIAAADPAAVDRWAALAEDFAFPDGEGIADFRERIRVAAERVISETAETVVLFAHGGVIRFLICHFLGLPDRRHLLFGVRPASISEIRIDGGKGVLTRLNDRCHLDTLAQLGNRTPEARIGDFPGRKMSSARRDHDFQKSHPEER
jgi:alpha-ribazole phosphatase